MAVLGVLTYCYVRCGSCAPSSRALPSLATLIERCPKQFRCVVKRGRPQETDIRSLRSLLMSRHRSRTAATHIHTQGIAMPDTCNIIASTVGALKLIARHRGLRAVLWEHDSPTRVRIVRTST